MEKYVFVVGGVMSSVGKGVAAASCAKLLESRGYNVTCGKIDPYINVDAGNMNPTEHGEAFVTDDGDLTDQDIGNYERFLNKTILSTNYMTTGRVYDTVIKNERNNKYNGKCVEVVPHIPQEVIRRIKNARKVSNADIIIIEIGGTVGEYQNLLFLEAARMLKLEQPNNVAFIMVSYLPIPSMVGEMKTKPTQSAVRTLNSAGIQPDILLCRAETEVDKIRKEKLSLFCNIPKNRIISAQDVASIYDIAINFKSEKLDDQLIEVLHLDKKRSNNQLVLWEELSNKIKNLKKEVKIAIIGQNFQTGAYVLTDSYLSVVEAIKHASWNYDIKPVITWLSSDINDNLKHLKSFDGIIMPDDFSNSNIGEMMNIIKYIRENNIPFLSIGFGMHLSVMEFARNVLKLKDITSEQLSIEGDFIINKVKKIPFKKINDNVNLKLGAYEIVLNKNSKSYKIYNKLEISERYKNGFEFNNYKELLEEKGMIIAGCSKDNNAVDIIELKNKFFIGVQFHPEFKSRPLNPHPLFLEFIKNCK